MGLRYSTVYQHDTNASFQANVYNTTAQDFMDDIAKKLGRDCVVIPKFSLRQRCKLCLKSMYLTPVVLLECGQFRHRYHATCMEKNIKHAFNKSVFKCVECRDILNEYINCIDVNVGESILSPRKARK
jgi:hypothetical protein